MQDIWLNQKTFPHREDVIIYNEGYQGCIYLPSWSPQTVWTSVHKNYQLVDFLKFHYRELLFRLVGAQCLILNLNFHIVYAHIVKMILKYKTLGYEVWKETYGHWVHICQQLFLGWTWLPCVLWQVLPQALKMLDALYKYEDQCNNNFTKWWNCSLT